MGYPPKSSSAPSPESTTFTYFRAFWARKYRGISEGLGRGSSSIYWMVGMASKKSSASTLLEMLGTPTARENSWA